MFGLLLQPKSTLWLTTPQHAHSHSVIFEIPLAGTRQHTNPSPPGSPANPIDVDSSSTSEVDPEKAFGINPFHFEATLQHIEELHSDPPRSPLTLGPLGPSHPSYHLACFECCCLGHWHQDCPFYQCPFCLKFHPGHTTGTCPSHPAASHCSTPPPVIKEELADYDDNYKYDEVAETNMTGEPCRDGFWESVILNVQRG